MAYAHARSHRLSWHTCAHKRTHNHASICGHVGVYAQTSMYRHISVPLVYVYIYIHQHILTAHIAGCIGTTCIDNTPPHTLFIDPHGDSVTLADTAWTHGCYTDAHTHAIIDPLAH